MNNFYLIFFFIIYNFFFSVQYNISPHQSFEPPSSTLRGDKHMHSWTFLYKIQFEQLLFEAFCVWRVFLAALSRKLIAFCPFSTISYFNHTNFSNPLAPLWRSDRRMHSRTFLYEIQFRTTFNWSFFSCDAYFWQCWALNWMYFAVSLHNNTSNMPIFWAP